MKPVRFRKTKHEKTTEIHDPANFLKIASQKDLFEIRAPMRGMNQPHSSTHGK